MNEQDQTKIWIPNLVFENSRDQKYTTNEALSTINIEKEGNFEIKFNFHLNEYHEYHGITTPFVYENTFDMWFLCELDLHFYPFDTQTCFIKVRKLNCCCPKKFTDHGIRKIKATVHLA